MRKIVQAGRPRRRARTRGARLYRAREYEVFVLGDRDQRIPVDLGPKG
jgi:hypothetical protein